LTVTTIFYAAFAHADELPGAFVNLQTAVSDVDSRATSAPAVASKESLSKLRKNVSLITRFSTNLSGDERSDYARSLNHDADLISMAAEADDPAEGARILSDAQTDLSIKTSFQANSGVSSRFNGRVTITVKTKRSGAVVNGYAIEMNPVRYAEDEPFIRFPNLSSPAQGQAPPGRYEVKALLNNKLVTQQVIDVGLQAEDLVSLDISVP
jgi:hypothetical protein